MDPLRLWVALGLSQLTALVIFGKRILVLNRWKMPPSQLQISALLVSLLSGALYWVSLNSVNSQIWIQVPIGIWSTVMSWAVYVVLVNDDFYLPSKQQLASLVFYLITETLIILQTRLLFSES